MSLAWYSCYMSKPSFPTSPAVGQVAMEYLIVLGLLTVIALTAFRTLVPSSVQETSGHFRAAGQNIVGDLPKTNIQGDVP